MEWQTTGPLVNDTVVVLHPPYNNTNNNAEEGVLTQYRPSHGRIPSLWKWNDSTIVLTRQDIESLTATTTNSSSSSSHKTTTAAAAVELATVVQERYNQVHETTFQSILLPHFILLAMMEESWFLYLQHEINNNNNNTMTTMERPLYYTTTTTTTTSILNVTTTGTTTKSINNKLTTTISPIALLSRMKQGIGLAAQYHYDYDASTKPFSKNNNNYTTPKMRRSQRTTMTAATTMTLAKPGIWQKGGRIANYILDQYYNDWRIGNAIATTTNGTTTATTTTIPSSSSSGMETTATTSATATQSELVEASSSQENETNDDDEKDDDDYETRSPSEEEEEDVLEGVEPECIKDLGILKNKESVVQDDTNEHHSETATTTDDDDEEEESIDYVLTNPYFPPDTKRMVEYLGKRIKSLRLEDLVGPIVTCLKKKLELAPEMTIPDRISPLRLESSAAKVHKDTVLSSTYTLVSSVNQPKTLLDTAMIEQKEKQLKAWSSWRFKGIHGGCALWPMWTAENMIPLSAKSSATKAPAAVASEPPPSELLDVTSRRSGRVVTTTGVYYGTPSNMSQKQLLETVLRLCRQVVHHTLPSLEALVGDEAGGTRLATALAALVWKRRQVLQCRVTTKSSDAVVQFPLLTMTLDDEEEDKNPPAPLEPLLNYLQDLHRTELQLRHLIVTHLTQRSIPTVATAADERLGSLESMDALDFDPTSIEWLTTGHECIGSHIFRPPMDQRQCQWWTIQDYCPAIPSEDDETMVSRRARFRAVDDSNNTVVMILTEGQVQSGILAGQMQQQSSNQSNKKHPLSGLAGTKMTFRPIHGNDGNDLHCTMAGHCTVEGETKVQHRILVMPDSLDKSALGFWVSVQKESDGSLTCQPLLSNSTTTYTLLQSDYDQGSPAFDACRAIVNYLKNHARSDIFLTPVDPVALGIPTYFSVVKHPMDITTLETNLENGLYSKAPSGTTSGGRSAVARMLNGPFRDDAILIFDNAILFNPPDDWIHQTAASIRKALIKKLDQAVHDAEYGGSARRGGAHKQYLDLDSDVDMDENYESDTRESSRKRKAGGSSIKEDYALQAKMMPLRLQNVLNESSGLKGPFAELPIISDPSLFSLTPEWNCRHKGEEKEDPAEKKRREEMEEILELQRLIEEEEKSSVCRSARASHATDDGRGGSKQANKGGLTLEYYLPNDSRIPLPNDDGPLEPLVAISRKKLEAQLEMAHELYYAKSYKHCSKQLFSESGYGEYANDSFPPYLGRVVVDGTPDGVVWEIRSTYIVPALRWVLRGLIQSGHVTAMEPMSMDSPMSSGVIIPNDIYYIDKNIPSFGIFEGKKAKKRDHQSNEDSSEEEIELSEYERMRAERVARNAERLKALGLA